MPNTPLPKMPGVPVRQVAFRDGPPVVGNHKVYHLPNWGKLGDRGRVAAINKLIKQYGRDPRLRQVALSIIRGAGVQPRDYEGQAAALLKWVNTNIYYINEPGEQLQSVWYTLKTRSGDCDDCHILLASLAESVRIPWRTVLSGRDKTTGQRTRWVSGTPFPANVRFAHIYTMLGWPPFRPQRWTFADPSLKNSYLGWDIVNHKQMPPVPGAPPELMPEMSGYGVATVPSQRPTPAGHACPPGYDRVTGVIPGTRRAVSACVPESLLAQREASAELKIEDKVNEEERKAFWASIDWKNVLSVALPTIISGVTLAYFARRRK